MYWHPLVVLIDLIYFFNLCRISIAHQWRVDLFVIYSHKFRVSYQIVTIYLEGLADMDASNWLTSMVENNP